MGDAAALREQARQTGFPEGLVLIDGACVLCSAAFRFVAKRDRAARFLFAPIQLSPGRDFARDIGIDPDAPDSFAVFLGGRALLKSDGVIAILQALPGWRWSAVFRAVPRPLRDWVYDRIARNRTRLFGRMDACMMPDPALRTRMFRADGTH